VSRNIFSKIKNKYYFYNQFLFFRALKYSILAFLILRIFSSLILLIGIIHPSPNPPFTGITTDIFNKLNQQGVFTRYFLAPWYRWDTAHYLVIAEFGYDFDPINTIWPPLFPFLIRCLSVVFHPPLVSAILVSNIFFIVGLFLTFILTKEIFDEQVAKNTLFFLIIFPTSFFFIAAYSESLFLTLSVAVFLLLRRKKWLWAGLVSAFASLTRVQGVFLALAIAIEIFQEYLKNRSLKYLLTNLISCLYAPFAYGLYSLYVFFGLNTDWPWTVLTSNWGQHFGLPWEGIIGSLNVFFLKMIFNDNPPPVYLLNVIFSLFTIYLLFYLRKKIPFSISVYSWVMLFLILGKIDINNALVSTLRYLIILFPIYIG